MNNREEDEELIKKIKKGNTDAFEEIVIKYQQKVYTTVYYMLQNKENAEDVAQEVFLKVFKNLSKFNEQSSLYTWIYRITVNCCYDQIRKEQKVVSIDSFYQDEESDDSKEIEIPDESQNIDKIMDEKYIKENLIKAVSALPIEPRTVLILRDIRGLSYWQISDILKLNIGTVKSRISRARELLKTKLESQGFEYQIESEDEE